MQLNGEKNSRDGWRHLPHSLQIIWFITTALITPPRGYRPREPRTRSFTLSSESTLSRPCRTPSNSASTSLTARTGMFFPFNSEPLYSTSTHSILLPEPKKRPPFRNGALLPPTILPLTVETVPGIPYTKTPEDIALEKSFKDRTRPGTLSNSDTRHALGLTSGLIG
jgi:hypothetical protein